MKKTLSIDQAKALMTQQTNKTYLYLMIAFAVSLITALVLPLNDIFKGIASLPAIGALISIIYQILKDQAAFERQLKLQRKQQFYNTAVTSNIANIAFNKHIEFCEKYMTELRETVITLIKEGPCENALNHANKLYTLRCDYSLWLTNKIDSDLFPFEQALRKIGAKAHLIESLRTSNDSTKKEKRLEAIEDMYELFIQLNIENLNGEIDENVAVESVKRKLRTILGIEELTFIRDKVIQEVIDLDL